MTTEEIIRQEAADSGAEIIDWKFESNAIKWLYCDGVIAVSSSVPTSTERACILAEELGHHLTASGNILDQKDAGNRKQELRGRIWAYNRLIGLEGIVRAYKAGCRNCFEVAEYLEVTEEMLRDALEQYRERYGICARCGEYVVYFEPIGVMRLM